MSLKRNSLLFIALTNLGLIVSCTDAVTDAPLDRAAPVIASQKVTGPTLLECPIGQSASVERVVGLLGGLLQLGDLRVQIPSGVLALPQRFRLTVPASPYMEISVSAVGLGHFLFRGPVTVTIDYSRCPDSVLERGPLSVFYIDEQSKALLQDMGGVDDRANRRITFTTDHFSGYAIAN